MFEIELTKPITASDGREIKVLKLRDVTIGDVTDAQKSSGTELETDVKLLQLIAMELAPEDIRALSPKDYQNARAYLVENFF